MKAPLPANEAERLQALLDYDILDTGPEKDFDDLTAIAAQISGTPIALVSLVDAERQWFKSKVGIDATETPRDVAFCAHAILGNSPLIVPDARTDERFCDNPLVVDDPSIRFYAGAPLETPSGHKLGTLCVIDSIPHELTTEQIEALRALSRQVISQLELRSKIVLLRKKSRQLEDLKQAAEQANRAKSRFLASMSHELRTPMNAIIGYSEMLQEDAEEDGNDAYIDDLKKIQTAAKHLLGLINDILDLSKVEAGKMELHPEHFELKPCIEEIASTILPLVNSNSNRLEIDCAADAGVMNSDMTRFRQILLNLLSNAAKFTEGGTISLSVTRRKDAGEGSDVIVIQVIDSGIGMTREQITKLFQPFSQADSSTTRKYGGTGLGLSLTKRFCEMLGGRISVESTPGSGTKFSVELPANTSKPANRDSPETCSAADQKDSPGIRPRVLVIDDDPAARDLAQRVLEREGYQVAVAVGGEQGLSMIREQTPDCILLDVMMPGMDGWSVIQRVKQVREFAGIPIIMHSMVDEPQLGLSLGAVDYLIKPTNREELAAAVRKVVPLRGN